MLHRDELEVDWQDAIEEVELEGLNSTAWQAVKEFLREIDKGNYEVETTLDEEQSEDDEEGFGRDERSQEIFEESGEVSGESKLQCFLYLLMRDEVPPGKIASIIRDVDCEDEEWTYSNGWLAKYAEYLEENLT